MVYMQSRYLKIVGPIVLIFAFFSSSAQTTSHRLKTADSLFNAKRYTQSFEHYQQMLKQQEYTPAMLLKMAFIKEGLLEIGQSMYYLNLYFIATNDEEALDKMKELAQKYNLEGYESSESDKFLTFYHDNYLYVSLAIAAFIVLGMSMVFYSRFSLRVRPIISFCVVIFFSATLFVHLYYGERLQTGIITTPSTYVMSGPSAGANLVEIIGDGHRVEVVGKSDVWLKIRWDGDVAYVRENAVVEVQL
jgi:hypothetical protein